jgi:hypothetical protein
MDPRPLTPANTEESTRQHLESDPRVACGVDSSPLRRLADRQEGRGPVSPMPIAAPPGRGKA